MIGLTLASRDLGGIHRRPSIGMRVVTPMFLAMVITVLLAGGLPSLPHPIGSPASPEASHRPVATSSGPPAGASGSSPTWTNVSTSVAPPARDDGVMAYDAKDGYIVLFGGERIDGVEVNATTTLLNDTWTYKAGVWTQLAIPGPPGSLGAAIAYDPVDGYLVVVGGCGGYQCANVSAGTWIFSGGEWSELDVPAPLPLVWPEIAWDPALGELILCGGTSASGSVRNTGTWGFLHGSWTNLSVIGPTLFPVGGGMSYVPAAGGLVLFGGQPTPAHSTSDSWLFDGTWKHLPESGPQGRSGAPLTDEMTSGFGVLFGGENSTWCVCGVWWNITYLGDTWVYTGSAWEQVYVPGPSPRVGSQLAWDAGDGYVLLFGGLMCYRGGPVANCSYIYSPIVDSSDSWAFSLGPVATVVNVSVTPGAICVLGDYSCAAGTQQAVVTVTVQALYAPGSTGTASLGTPALSFLPWGQVELDATQPIVSCQIGADGSVVCTRDATGLQVGGTTGFQVAWRSLESFDTLFVGDTWSVQFGITVAGPPYGSVPVDACTTAECFAHGSGPIDGYFSNVSHEPLVPGPRTNGSLPYANVTVDAPRIPSGGSTAPVVAPPSPPGAPVPLPGPVTLPSPVSVPAPILAALAVSVPALSLSAAAAGMLSAGVARVVLQRRAIAQGQPVGNVVRAPRSAFDPARPTDVAVGRFE